MPIEINKRVFILIAIIIGVVGLVISLVAQYYHPLSEDTVLEMKIKVIDKPNLIALYQSNVSIIIVDCSESGAYYKAGYRLPSAVWFSVPSAFYNTNKSVVVYSNDDNVSRVYCVDLLKHIKSDVYLFKGGYAVWNKEG